MSNFRFYLIAVSLLLIAMMIRVISSDGSIIAILFVQNSFFSSFIGISFGELYGFVRNMYIHLIDNIGYLYALGASIVLFRVLYFPIELKILFIQNKKLLIEDELSEIRSTYSDFKVQSKQIKECYLKNNINMLFYFSLILLKIVGLICFYYLINHSSSFEVQYLKDNRVFINILLSVILYVVSYFNQLIQPFSHIQKQMAFFLPLVLSVCSFVFFPVTLMILIVSMQFINVLYYWLGKKSSSFFNDEEKFNVKASSL